MSAIKLIVGLGNPGKAYAATRHNIGFRVVEELARRHKMKLGQPFFSRKAASACASAQSEVSGNRICLLLPLTFMNNSGAAVAPFVRKKEIELKDLLVVCDDFNLDFGQLRVRPDGSGGGHNGLSSVMDCLGSKEFARLRLGVGNPVRGQDPAEFVLEAFSSREKKELDSFIQQAADCCEVWLTGGVEKAMNQFNKRQ